MTNKEENIIACMLIEIGIYGQIGEGFVKAICGAFEISREEFNEITPIQFHLSRSPSFIKRGLA